MSDSPPQPAPLRLVAGDAAPPQRPLRARRAARATARRVGSENASAAGLSPTDARWVFALRVAEGLEGGPAAILPPERRRRLVAQAVGLGLREFDANLVIAIVQDAVRTGEGATSPAVEGRLGLIRSPGQQRRARPGDVLVHIALALLLATAILLVLIGLVAG